MLKHFSYFIYIERLILKMDKKSFKVSAGEYQEGVYSDKLNLNWVIKL